MTKIAYILIGLALVVGFVLGVIGTKSPDDLGKVIYDRSDFVGDIHSGMTGVKVISDGEIVGPINTSQAATLSGATTLSGTAHISQSASSTLQIGSTASGLGVGCIAIGDSGGATSTPVYITATGASLSATTTKPQICR